MKGRAGRTEHFGRNSRKALPKKDPIYNMVCLRWWKRCVRRAELGGWSWRTMESSPASWTRSGGLLLVFGGHREVGYFFRLFAMGRLSLPEGTFVSSRRDVRLFPKGRSLSAIGITTTHSLSVTAIAPWGVVRDGECEKGKQGRGFVRRVTPRQSGGRSRG